MTSHIKRRMMIIDMIIKSLEIAKDPDLERLVWLICKDHGCTIRKAREYIKIAQMHLDQQHDPHAP